MEAIIATLETKERSINFSKRDMERLQSLISKHQNVLFCKKTDGVSTKQKDSAWNLIELEFNSGAETPRTIKQLKYKFENLKRAARKGASKERQELRRTGGGPPLPTQPGLEETTDWLRSIEPSSVDGNKAIYDDDTLAFPANKPINPPKIKEKDITSEIIDECVSFEKIPTNENVTSAPEFDSSTPYSSLKRPMSSPLTRRAKKQKQSNGDNFVRQLWREKNLAIIDKLQELELKKLNDSIKHAQEVHGQTLRHNEERHHLELEKLKLEIQLLKKNLEE